MVHVNKVTIEEADAIAVLMENGEVDGLQCVLFCFHCQ
jgi:hypothetical protein